jgi:hypothetical protein
MTTPDAPATRPGLLERLLGQTEPIRRAMYPVIVAAVALLVFYGRLDPNSVPLWLALAVAVLSIGGTEIARRVAWSPSSVDDYGDEVLGNAERYIAELEEHAADEYARGVAAGAGIERTPDELAAETAELRMPGAHRPDRCREVEGGRRCRLAPHADPTEGGMPHKFD